MGISLSCPKLNYLHNYKAFCNFSILLQCKLEIHTREIVVHVPCVCCWLPAVICSINWSVCYFVPHFSCYAKMKQDKLRAVTVDFLDLIYLF